MKMRRPGLKKALDTLIAELLRARAEDPPLSDDDIRHLRVEGRP